MVTMKDLLECGVHFGHQTRRWNQKMKKFGKWLINNVKFSIREDATDKYIFYGGHSDEIYTMDEIVDIYKRELLKIKHKGNL